MSKRKKTVKINDVQKNCQKDARLFVQKWFEHNDIWLPDSKYIGIEWFAFTSNGYICSLSATSIKPDMFFELRKNMSTGEYVCNVFNRFEHIVMYDI